jgi:hypothetical protein
MRRWLTEFTLSALLASLILCPGKSPRAEDSQGPSQNSMVSGELNALSSNTSLPSDTSLPTKKEGDYLVVPLNYLSNYTFHYLYPDPKTGNEKLPDTETIARVNQMIPEAIRALDGQKIVTKGFMIPIAVNEQTPTTLVITHNASGCCFGVAPKMNGWIYIQTNKKTKNQANVDEPYIPVSIYGTLKVGLQIVDGETVILYGMAADKITQAKLPY